MLDSLSKYIRSCTSITEEELDYFLQQFRIVKFPKKTILLNAGEICNFEAYVTKGCIKSYFLNSLGNEVILTFATENWWVSDIISFHEQKPAKIHIECIEACELLSIDLEHKNQVLKQIPSLERMFRLLVQRHLAMYQERLFATIAQSAEERYKLFLEKYPHLQQRVPLHSIAAFLGISPESLSRIRAKDLKKS
jgi:CRP-like cAMP-binding protein